MRQTIKTNKSCYSELLFIRVHFRGFTTSIMNALMEPILIDCWSIF